jgi:hypothetical protein
MLVLPVLLCYCLPAAFAAQLRDRRFQAGCKAWLASTIALVVIAAAYTQLGFLGVSAALLTGLFCLVWASGGAKQVYQT